MGTKRHVLTDAKGVPLGISVTGANVPDVKGAEPTVNASGEHAPPWGGRHKPRSLCMDKGYDSALLRERLRKAGIVPHGPRRGEPPLVGPMPRGKPRRWVVERTNSWHNRFRALLIRWDVKASHYLALCHLASGIIALRLALSG